MAKWDSEDRSECPREFKAGSLTTPTIMSYWIFRKTETTSAALSPLPPAPHMVIYPMHVTRSGNLGCGTHLRLIFDTTAAVESRNNTFLSKSFMGSSSTLQLSLLEQVLLYNTAWSLASPRFHFY
ncbi:hypothetical protein AX15_002026 [Amanita polypyramis BW_CC]|nr:hypothetical protein AX15_002026 [Amanita polypyramis BW_CC]